MVQQAIDTFGGLDILVNNAGLRPRPDAREHLRGGVGRGDPGAPEGPLRAAPARRRLLAGRGEGGRQRAARVINTSSGAGLQGSVGQATYSAAKAGIAGLTLVAAQEMGRYGVTVNAIAPVAKTRMTEGAFDTSAMAVPEDNSPIVAWLASEEAGDVTGRVIEIDGSTITVENGWAHGPSPRPRPRAGTRPRSAPPCATCSPRRPPRSPSTAPDAALRSCAHDLATGSGRCWTAAGVRDRTGTAEQTWSGRSRPLDPRARERGRSGAQSGRARQSLGLRLVARGPGGRWHLAARRPRGPVRR